MNDKLITFLEMENVAEINIIAYQKDYSNGINISIREA